MIKEKCWLQSFFRECSKANKSCLGVRLILMSFQEHLWHIYPSDHRWISLLGNTWLLLNKTAESKQTEETKEKKEDICVRVHLMNTCTSQAWVTIYHLLPSR